MKSIEFHPGAKLELIEEARFYQQLGPSLGYRFVDCVELTTASLARFPHRGHPVGQLLRSLRVPGFPHALIYRVERERLYILAVAHLSRRPGYWKSRT